MGNVACCDNASKDEFHPIYLNSYPKNEQSSHSPQKKQQTFVPQKQNNQNQNEEKQLQKDEKLNIEVIYSPSTSSLIPQLSPEIKKHLQTHKYFQEQFKFVPEVRQFDKQIYEGQLNKLSQKPEGFGKMHKPDGSLFIGHFSRGKAHGHGVYIMTNGSYYIGNFTNNCADGEGRFWSEELEYEGSFKNNAFHGKGSEKSRFHSYSGEYHEGAKQKGAYKWRDEENNEYSYFGHFNSSNQFNGDGVLEEPTGIYQGKFADGLKHGKGVYRYQNGLRYEGYYKQGLKCGSGILYNLGGSVAYQGQFQNDFPHGKGSITLPEKGKIQTKWIYGIDSVLL